MRTYFGRVVAGLALGLLATRADASEHWLMTFAGLERSEASQGLYGIDYSMEITSLAFDHRGQLGHRAATPGGAATSSGHPGGKVTPYALTVVRNKDASSQKLLIGARRMIPNVWFRLYGNSNQVEREMSLYNVTIARISDSKSGTETLSLIFDRIVYQDRHGNPTREENWSQDLAEGWRVGSIIRFEPARIKGHAVAAALASGGDYLHAADRFCQMQGYQNSGAINGQTGKVDAATWYLDTGEQCRAVGCGILYAVECDATKPSTVRYH